MPLPSSERVLYAPMRERGHRKPGVGDTEPGLLFGKQGGCGVYRLAFGFGCRDHPGVLDAMPKNQTVDFTHGFLLEGIFR